MIHRIIVEDINGVCIVNAPLKEAATPEQVKRAFEQQRLPIATLDVDTVGTCLVRLHKRYTHHL